MDQLRIRLLTSRDVQQVLTSAFILKSPTRALAVERQSGFGSIWASDKVLEGRITGRMTHTMWKAKAGSGPRCEVERGGRVKDNDKNCAKEKKNQRA